MSSNFTTSIECESGELLELRNNEIITFYTNWDDARDIHMGGSLYAFRLVDLKAACLDLPGGISDPDTAHTVVACRPLQNAIEIVEEECGWVWVSLSHRIQEAIASALKQSSYEEGWIYGIVRRHTDKQTATLHFKAEGLPYPTPFWLIVERPEETATFFKCIVDLNLCPQSFRDSLFEQDGDIETAKDALVRFNFANPQGISLVYPESWGRDRA